MGEISDAMARARDAARVERGRARPPLRPAPASPEPIPEEPAATFSDDEAALDEEAGPEERAPELDLEDVRRLAKDERSIRADPGNLGSDREVIHRIPTERDDHWRARSVLIDPHSTSAVRFPHLAVRIRSLLDRASSPSLLVTSATKGEGKTLVATNLALALASISPDHSIALADFDLRSASIASALGIEAKLGIEHVLSNKATIDEICVPTDHEQLDVFPVAHPIGNAAQVLVGQGAKHVLKSLVESYDYVIVDGPPVLPVPDAPILAPLVGGCLTVVRSRATRTASFRMLMDLIPRSSILGVFLNDEMEHRNRERHERYGDVAATDGLREGVDEEGAE